MFSFYMDNILFNSKQEYSGNPEGEHIFSSNILRKDQSKAASKIQIRDLNIKVGLNFLYLFDYGTSIIHQIVALKIRDKLPNDPDTCELSRFGNNVDQYVM